MIKFTTQLKKKVTQDWNALYPEMGVYKNMWLLKRTGPMVIGIYLDIPSGNDQYRILSHVHNLCRPLPGIVFSMAQWTSGLRGGNYVVPAMVHEERYKQGAMKLETETLLKLRGEMSFIEFITAYDRYMRMKENIAFVSNHIEEIFLLHVWAGKSYEEIRQLLDKYKSEMAKWPGRTLTTLGEYGLQGWYNKIEEAIKNRKNILETVDEEIVKHKLQKIPYKPLIID